MRKKMDEMEEKFIARGNPKTLVKHQRLKAVNKERHILLTGTNRCDRTTKEKRVRFISTYNHNSMLIMRANKKYWAILGTYYKNIKEFSNPPLFSFRRTRNIRDRIVKTDISDKGGQERQETRRMGVSHALDETIFN